MSEVRIEIGFQGGGSISGTVDQAQWDQLEASFKGDGGWATINTRDDAQLLVDTGKVIYARVLQLSRSVGFGT